MVSNWWFTHEGSSPGGQRSLAGLHWSLGCSPPLEFALWMLFLWLSLCIISNQQLIVLPESLDSGQHCTPSKMIHCRCHHHHHHRCRAMNRLRWHPNSGHMFFTSHIQAVLLSVQINTSRKAESFGRAVWGSDVHCINESLIILIMCRITRSISKNYQQTNI